MVSQKHLGDRERKQKKKVDNPPALKSLAHSFVVTLERKRRKGSGPEGSRKRSRRMEEWFSNSPLKLRGDIKDAGDK